ncbi:MAG: oxygen-independent coproporphyrinogen-3 oxidase [Hyphomicrobiaceae bacterium]|jgi:oxygen-independent coproporphyrinogen-3 oxidase
MILDVPHELLSRYDQPGPRYTSYPTAPVWSQEFGPDEHRESLVRANEQDGKGMSLYVHLPFCRSMCFYCGCSVIIARDPKNGDRYVGEVLQEAALARTTLQANRPVVQHHWGGGTPTFLTPEQLERLFKGLLAIYPHTPDAEISIEVDPRVTSVRQLEVLRECGFNRISMGVQDFDEEVQKAINRIQPYEQTRDLVQASRSLGFASVNLDLVYGLPHQTAEKFADSIQKVLGLRPDRLACYGYAHVPWLKKHQEVISVEDLPRGSDKLDLYLLSLNAFQDAGYEAIGMDHFALPEDGLVKAANSGNLHRNFMGYATHQAEDMLSFGVTSISEVAGSFAQNVKQLNQYREHLDAGRLPVERGMRRSEDDEKRRAIILDLMCRFSLDYDAHGGAEAFRQQYGSAMAAMTPLAKDGLIELDDRGIRVTPIGRLFVRNVAMPFDVYLEKQRQAKKPMFSRTV